MVCRLYETISLYERRHRQTAPNPFRIGQDQLRVEYFQIRDAKIIMSTFHASPVTSRFDTFPVPCFISSPKTSFSQNTHPNFRKILFSMEHSKSTQQRGHFALRTIRIGCGSSENENKTVQNLVFSEFVIVTFSKVRNS